MADGRRQQPIKKKMGYLEQRQRPFFSQFEKGKSELKSKGIAGHNSLAQKIDGFALHQKRDLKTKKCGTCLILPVESKTVAAKNLDWLILFSARSTTLNIIPVQSFSW